MLTLVLVSFQQIWGGKRWWHWGLILVNMHVTKMAQELCVGHLQTFSRVKPVEMSLSSSWQEPGGGGSVPASGELCLVSTDKLWMIERWAHVRLHTWVIPAASSSPPCVCVSVCVCSLYLNLPPQCWHWSPTQPGKHTQLPVAVLHWPFMHGLSHSFASVEPGSPESSPTTESRSAVVSISRLRPRPEPEQARRVAPYILAQKMAASRQALRRFRRIATQRAGRW